MITIDRWRIRKLMEREEYIITKEVFERMIPSLKEQLKSENEEFKKVIKKHVETEHKMLEFDFEKIVDKTEDNRIRFILMNIISHEKTSCNNEACLGIPS